MRFFLLACATAFLSLGCAVQGQLGQQSTTLVGGSNEFVTVNGASDSLTTKGVAFYDSTGLLLAALTTAGNAHRERTIAYHQAVASGASSFTYTVNIAAPTPGLWTKFERVWGESDELEFTFTNVKMTFHTFVLGEESETRSFLEIPQLALGIAFFQSSITTDQFAGNTEDSYALPLSATYTMVTPGMKNLRGSVGAGLDLVSPFFGGIGYEAEARIDFFVFPWLSVFAVADHRSTVADGGDTRIKTAGIHAGITAYYFGDS